MNIFLSLIRYTWNSREDRINKRKTSGYLVSRSFLGVPWGLGLVGTWWLSLETRRSLKPDSVSWMGPHWAGKATGSVMRGKDSYNNRRRKWSQKNKRRRKSSNELQKNQRGKENPREAGSQTTDVPQGKCSLLTEVQGTWSLYFISAVLRGRPWIDNDPMNPDAVAKLSLFLSRMWIEDLRFSGFLYRRPHGHTDVTTISWKNQQGQEGRRGQTVSFKARRNASLLNRERETGSCQSFLLSISYNKPRCALESCENAKKWWMRWRPRC